MNGRGLFGPAPSHLLICSWFIFFCVQQLYDVCKSSLNVSTGENLFSAEIYLFERDEPPGGIVCQKRLPRFNTMKVILPE